MQNSYYWSRPAKEIRRRKFNDTQAVILFPSILDGQAI